MEDGRVPGSTLLSSVNGKEGKVSGSKPPSAVKGKEGRVHILSDLSILLYLPNSILSLWADILIFAISLVV